MAKKRSNPKKNRAEIETFKKIRNGMWVGSVLVGGSTLTKLARPSQVGSIHVWVSGVAVLLMVGFAVYMTVKINK